MILEVQFLRLILVIVRKSLYFAESKHPHVSIGSRNGEHRIVMGEVDSGYFARHIEDGAERLIVVALVEQLHFVRSTASCNDQILMLLAELTGIE